jgi:hypothetical protein
MVKKSSTSAAEMEALLAHAVVQTKARTGEGQAETRAARELDLQLLGVVRSMPTLRTWRARSGEAGAQVGLVTLADAATPAERDRFSSGVKDLEAARDALQGVLPVRQLTAARDAFWTDLWTTGTAKDLSALGWPVRRRLEFGVAIAQALGSLHAVGLVHGALCADNVLLDDALGPVLSEAGLVSVSALIARKSARAYEPFAAPEVREGSPPDARSDVYSAGKVILGFFSADAELPAGVREVLDRCAMPAPLRHADAKTLAEALQSALDAIPADSAVRPLAPRPPPKREPDASPQPFAAPGKREPSPPWKPPVALGVGGIVLMVGSAAAAAFVGGSNDLLRAIVTWGLPLGVVLASTLAPPLPKNPTLIRFVLALGLLGLVFVFDPITLAFRMAAHAHMRGDDAARRKAVEEILAMGRDFRGMSLAGLNLSGFDMTGADLRRVNLSGADLTGTRLFAAEVDAASFDSAQLAGADLQQTALELANTGGARCDATTRLPPTFACTGGHVQRNR